MRQRDCFRAARRNRDSRSSVEQVEAEVVPVRRKDNELWEVQ